MLVGLWHPWIVSDGKACGSAQQGKAERDVSVQVDAIIIFLLTCRVSFGRACNSLNILFTLSRRISVPGYTAVMSETQKG